MVSVRSAKRDLDLGGLNFAGMGHSTVAKKPARQELERNETVKARVVGISCWRPPSMSFGIHSRSSVASLDESQELAQE
jgi:hypothetical protein